MCKVFAMSNMKKVQITKKFLNAVKTEVTRTGDKHGFGYAVLGEDGSIGGERTMRPMNWQPLQGNPMATKTHSLPIVLRTRDQFGKVNFDAPKSFIGHGRYSTNDVALQNTHPFYNGDVALIHNGVVRDPDGIIPATDLKTTNDTEIILRCWEKGGMPMVESTVTGYYALALLDKAGLLHIVRDDTAPLFIAYSRTVDSYIFATTEDIIRSVSKKMQWVIETPEELLENIHVILDRNEIMTQKDISPRIDTRGYMSAKEAAAFGSGDNRGSSTSRSHGYGGWGGSMPTAHNSSVGGIIDASMAGNKGKNEVAVAPEEAEEPSYREVPRMRAAEAAALGMDSDGTDFHQSVVEGETDRSFIDDGAPNVTSAVDEFPYNDDGSPTNGIDGWESPYDARKIS